MGQYSYFLHFGFLSFYQFVHFLLRFGQWSKASIILIDLIEPQRLVFPMRSRRHHQFRSCIKQIYHIRLPPERHHVLHSKSISLSSVFITHGRCTFSLIKLKLHLFFHRNTDLVHFTHGRLTAPKWNNVIELATHGRYKPGIILRNSSQQSVCKSLFRYFIIYDITGVQSPHFYHNLSCSPINSTGRSRIVTGLLHIHLFNLPVSMIYRHTFKLGMGRQRIIIIFNHPVSYCSFRSLHLDNLTYGK